MYDKYIKINSEHYAIGNNDMLLIKADNEENLKKYLQTQNELETTHTNFKKINNMIKQVKTEDKARRISNIMLPILILIFNFILYPALSVSTSNTFPFEVLLSIDIFAFSFFKFVSTVFFGLKHTNKKRLDKLVKKQEVLTNKIKELNETLTELKTNNKIQKKENNDIKTIIKPMKHDNTEVKPLVRKLTNN